METLNREDILRMIGLRDSAGLYSKINSLMIDMYDEGGKLAEYSTQIIQTEKNITLLAQRVTDDETDIADLTVTAQKITASVSSLTTTVNGHTQSIGQLQITANNLTASVSSLTTTVNGHTSKIAALEITDSSISNRVTVIEGDYVKNAQISLMVKYDPNTGYISNALVNADDINFVFTDAVTWYWQSQTEANKRMGLDNDGNLWISGQYRGGTITDNVTIGTGTNNMVIRPRGTNGAELVGLVNNNTTIRLWFQGGDTGMLDLTGSHFSASYWDAGFLTYRTGSSGSAFAISMDGTGKIHIGSYANQGSMAVWPRSRNDVEIGQVFLGNDEILRVKTE